VVLLRFRHGEETGEIPLYLPLSTRVPMH